MGGLHVLLPPSKGEMKPIFTFDRFSMDPDGRTRIPVSLHVHHGVLDGRHASMLVSRMAEKLLR